MSPDLVSVLIPAAGMGERMGMGPKALLTLHGRPVVDWVVDKARQLGSEVLVACPAGMESSAGTVRVPGGATRQESVLRLASTATRPWAILWDAASPFASLALARRALAAAPLTGAAVPFLPALVPWLEVDGDRVRQVHPAAGTGSGQTPQAYATAVLQQVSARAQREGWQAQSTVQLVVRAGVAVTAVPGERLNFKLTTEEDWELAQALYARLRS